MKITPYLNLFETGIKNLIYTSQFPNARFAQNLHVYSIRVSKGTDSTYRIHCPHLTVTIGDKYNLVITWSTIHIMTQSKNLYTKGYVILLEIHAQNYLNIMK